MKIAVVGCAHGELDNMYATLQYLERVENMKIDLLICCGDFQAVRNDEDLQSLHCPAKFRTMHDFWKYYSGAERAPFPTIFIGGNHEASNYLWELYYGGFVAPNIYFLGIAGVVKFGGIRIAGLSGIFNNNNYCKGHFERAPYDSSDMCSVYHVREYDVNKLLQLQGAIDVFVSHDWPQGIVNHAPQYDVEQLLNKKPYFQKEIAQDILGSIAGKMLLHELKPVHWFSAHLHTKFAVVVHHPNNHVTKFLALDKCLPGCDFLQVLDVAGPAACPLEFTYNEDWLTITQAYNPHMPFNRWPVPHKRVEVEPQQRRWVHNRLVGSKSAIPTHFTQTAPPYIEINGLTHGRVGHMRNPQTMAFLELLDLPYLLDREPPTFLEQCSTFSVDPNEIVLDDE